MLSSRDDSSIDELNLVLLNDWVDVFVEECWLNKERLEDGLSHELLEVSGGQVKLEGGSVDELTEEWESEVLLEKGKSVQLTEGVGVHGDVGGDVELLSGWHEGGGGGDDLVD